MGKKSSFFCCFRMACFVEHDSVSSTSSSSNKGNDVASSLVALRRSDKNAISSVSSILHINNNKHSLDGKGNRYDDPMSEEEEDDDDEEKVDTFESYILDAKV